MKGSNENQELSVTQMVQKQYTQKFRQEIRNYHIKSIIDENRIRLLNDKSNVPSKYETIDQPFVNINDIDQFSNEIRYAVQYNQLAQIEMMIKQLRNIQIKDSLHFQIKFLSENLFETLIFIVRNVNSNNDEQSEINNQIVILLSNISCNYPKFEAVMFEKFIKNNLFDGLFIQNCKDQYIHSNILQIIGNNMLEDEIFPFYQHQHIENIMDILNEISEKNIQMISVIEKITFVVKILIYREENIEGEILTEKLRFQIYQIMNNLLNKSDMIQIQEGQFEEELKSEFLQQAYFCLYSVSSLSQQDQIFNFQQFYEIIERAKQFIHQYNPNEKLLKNCYKFFINNLKDMSEDYGIRSNYIYLNLTELLVQNITQKINYTFECLQFFYLMFCVPFEYYRDELPFQIEDCQDLFISLKLTSLDYTDLNMQEQALEIIFFFIQNCPTEEIFNFLQKHLLLEFIIQVLNNENIPTSQLWDGLDTLQDILDRGNQLNNSQGQNQNLFLNIFISLQGEQILEKLQDHSDNKIFTKVQEIIENFFEFTEQI